MIDGDKYEIEGVSHNIDGAKCQVVKYFVQSCQVKYSLFQSNQIDGANYEMDGANYEMDGANYEMDGVKYEIDGVNHKIDGGNRVKQSSTL